MGETERRRRRVRPAPSDAATRSDTASPAEAGPPAAAAPAAATPARHGSGGPGPRGGGPRTTPGGGSRPVPGAGPRPASGAGAGGAEDREVERGLRGLVGSGSSQVSLGAALRARDAARPTPEQLAEADASLTIVRRHWTPREDLPRR
ncbi:hypothetical protein EV385_4374 [Krasilnikovia cinnamomea]|uniref:Uncharacterized protein n=1 Tax=Krasilnikovia cinnamomea TaxID=349313 RepID=A0A4Q7ZNA4_9ACTN|nr:hypothetical protein [Krasilnikovia cinnamomea]RZU52508.1 hypothetical protein EV385_4374 [Krasilnikovia cinnamomea]